VEVKGISDQKAQKLKDIIKSNNLVSLGFQSASSRLESMKDIIYISTGVTVLILQWCFLFISYHIDHPLFVKLIVWMII
jgi:hypothetical protein